MSNPDTNGLSSSDDSPLSPPSQAASKPTSTNPDLTSDLSASGSKRKQLRRVNTAERRASHNAVERQRRETLNGRFLDLAAILPNLSQIRRPSKSAIVNSSIACFHASRRHRAMASRELRILKLETDALRRELNDWRDRASIPRAQEPTRSDAFSIVLSGELEVLPVDLEEGEEVEDDLYASAGPPDDNFEQPFDAPLAYPAPPLSDPVNSIQAPQVPFNMGAPYPAPHDRRPMPMIASPTGIVENPFNGIGGASEPYPRFNEMDQGLQNKWNDQGQEFYSSFHRSRSSSYSDRTSSESRNDSPSGQRPPQYFEQNWNGNGMPNPSGNVAPPFGMII
ncbi:hypothetical protein GYMLUDRAFT_238752 [Collybiopsis luxurians FD-317 M1]|nr:hypothetical protein GYMLUDRAFT_238752 [Collybiopsis luxurians FD-317 M1]